MAWLTPASGTFDDLSEDEFQEFVAELACAINERRELIGCSAISWGALGGAYPAAADVADLRWHGSTEVLPSQPPYSEVYYQWRELMLAVIDLWDLDVSGEDNEAWCKSATNREVITQTGEAKATALANSYDIPGIATIDSVSHATGKTAIADVLIMHPKAPAPWRVIKEMLDCLRWPKWRIYELAGTVNHREGGQGGVTREASWDNARGAIHDDTCAPSAPWAGLDTQYPHPDFPFSELYYSWVAYQATHDFDASLITGTLIETIAHVILTGLGDDTTTAVTFTDNLEHSFVVTNQGAEDQAISFGSAWPSFTDSATYTLTCEIPEDCPFTLGAEESAWREISVHEFDVYTEFDIGTDLTYG